MYYIYKLYLYLIKGVIKRVNVYSDRYGENGIQSLEYM